MNAPQTLGFDPFFRPIIASSAPIPENTPMNLLIVGIDPWDAAQLESVFRDDEDWGHSLDYFIVKKAH
jgi:hypothetical protein